MSEAVLDHVSRARWFGGKGRGGRLQEVTALPWLSQPGEWPAVRPEVVEIGYDDESSELYQLLLAYRPLEAAATEQGALYEDELPGLGRVSVHDATTDPEALAVLVTALAEGHSVVEGGASLHCRTVPGHPLRADLVPRVFGGEQSNTSMMLGEVAMAKAFRRLEPGRNLDIEIHRGLAGDPRARAAGLYGWVEARWRSGSREHDVDLMMVVEQLQQAHDGWELALAACASQTSFDTEAHDLGLALRGVHDALAEHFGTVEISGEQLASTMRRRLAAAAREVPDLADLTPELDALFDRVAHTMVPGSRVHGDFHLGQTLRCADGWQIIDFEGEPMKTMAERREPDSPWRDVAGLLRSLDYAAGSVTAQSATEQSGLTSTQPQEWARTATTAFLTGYSRSALISPDEELLLQAYVADKAVYEVVYETRNRPAWVQIPRQALQRLVDPDHLVEPDDPDHPVDPDETTPDPSSTEREDR